MDHRTQNQRYFSSEPRTTCDYREDASNIQIPKQNRFQDTRDRIELEIKETNKKKKKKRRMKDHFTRAGKAEDIKKGKEKEEELEAINHHVHEGGLRDMKALV